MLECKTNICFLIFSFFQIKKLTGVFVNPSETFCNNYVPLDVKNTIVLVEIILVLHFQRKNFPKRTIYNKRVGYCLYAKRRLE